jgi:mono/diheme cytochrome c family protein
MAGRRVYWMMASALMLLTIRSALAEDLKVTAGRQVAQTWCINCHVVEPKQVRGSDQTPSFRAIANQKRTTAASLHAFLAIPHGRMPDQALSNRDMDAVVAYILSLKR